MCSAEKKLNPILWLAGFGALYAILYFLRYPPIFAFRDESIYLASAHLLKAGTLWANDLGMPNHYFVEFAGRLVSLYPFGNALALLPFTLISWKACFLLGLFCHLAGTFLFARFLKLCRGLHPLWALLYLFFPSFVFYSRTLMGDLPSMFFFFLGVYCYYKPGQSLIWAGIFWGYSLTFRLTNAVALIPFLISVLIQSAGTKKIKPILEVSAGISFFVFLLMLQNFFSYGSIFRFGLSSHFSGVENFSIKHLPSNLLHYGSSLMLFYPLMMFAFLNPAVIRKFTAWWISGLLLVSMYAVYYFHDQFSSKVATLLLGNRYLYPVFPLLLLSYADGLRSLSRRFPDMLLKFFGGVLLIGLILSSFLIFNRHQKALLAQADLKNLIYENTPENSVLIHDYNSAELLNMEWGKREYVFPRKQNLLSLLESFPGDREIYIAARDLDLPGAGAGSEFNDVLGALQRENRVELIAEHERLRIFRRRS